MSPHNELLQHIFKCMQQRNIFRWHADTPHRTGQLHGLSHHLDCFMSHSLHGIPLDGPPQWTLQLRHRWHQGSHCG